MDVVVLNKGLNPIAIIDDYISFIWTERYSECGDFELYLPMDKRYLDIFKLEYYITISQSDRLMLIEEINVETDVEDGNKFIVTGRSIEALLERRIVAYQTTCNNKVLIEVLEKLVRENVCSIDGSFTPLEGRNIEKIEYVRIYDTPGPGSHIPTWDNWPSGFKKNISVQYYGESMYEAIKSVCEENKLGFKVVWQDKINQTDVPWQDEYRPFKLCFYAGVDRSYDQSENVFVVFSPEFDNIINSNYLETINQYKNLIYVGGEGEGYDKTIELYWPGKPSQIPYGDPPTGFDRREVFVNASGVSSKTDSGTLSDAQYRALLSNYGKNELEKTYKIKKGFDGEVDSKSQWVYGRDFSLGDIVQIEDQYGNTGKSYVSEVVISDDDSGYAMYPTFKDIEEE